MKYLLKLSYAVLIFGELNGFLDVVFFTIGEVEGHGCSFVFGAGSVIETYDGEFVAAEYIVEVAKIGIVFEVLEFDDMTEYAEGVEEGFDDSFVVAWGDFFTVVEC